MVDHDAAKRGSKTPVKAQEALVCVDLLKGLHIVIVREVIPLHGQPHPASPTLYLTNSKGVVQVIEQMPATAPQANKMIFWPRVRSWEL